jgi:NAD(P)-dependent dehydrogenase (short-subunit alcohol dehydrogenase family)
MTRAQRWSEEDISSQAGRVAVVTGAAGAIGLETVRMLAGKGARVVMACRDLDAAEVAAQTVRARVADADITYSRLDLADLDSVREFAETLLETSDGLDVLVNNAATAGGPRRATRDGFDRHLGSNHLGHFALTGRLMPGLLARPGSRVVTLTSSVANTARIDFGDLQLERRYRFVDAYARSKLASLLFAAELNRRAHHAAISLTSIAADPGITRTPLVRARRSEWGTRRGAAELAVATAQRLAGQPAQQGALMPAFAATDLRLRGGELVLPDGRGHKRGHPSKSPLPAAALDPATARRLWETSSELTKVSFNFE